MTQPLVEHRLELAGFDTRALELEGEGPPLVLLHGFADSADTWRLVLDRLARLERRAIALDLPGFATAGRLAPGAVLPQLDAFAAAAIRHAAAEAGEDVVVAGNSLGGCMALRAAQDAELPLRGAVPVAPAGFDHPVWFRIIETFPLVRAMLAAPLPEQVVRLAVGEAYRQLAFARPRAVAAEVVNAFTAHHRRRADAARHLEVGRRLLPELHGCFDLAQIARPLLLVWGDRDRMVTHRGSRHVVEVLGGREDFAYELYEGCGHCPQVEAPERLTASLEAFASSATIRR
jgi:pimeloyl-ACP methyl ester carboxylesterase